MNIFLLFSFRTIVEPSGLCYTFPEKKFHLFFFSVYGKTNHPALKKGGGIMFKFLQKKEDRDAPSDGGRRLLKILSWTFFIVYAVFQLLAVIGLAIGRNNNYPVWPYLAVTLVWISAFAGYWLLKRFPVACLVGFWLATAGLVYIAFDLLNASKGYTDSFGNTFGLDVTKLVWRHLGAALTPVFLTAFHRVRNEHKTREEMKGIMEKLEQENSSRSSIFKDSE